MTLQKELLRTVNVRASYCLFSSKAVGAKSYYEGVLYGPKLKYRPATTVITVTLKVKKRAIGYWNCQRLDSWLGTN